MEHQEGLIAYTANSHNVKHLIFYRPPHTIGSIRPSGGDLFVKVGCSCSSPPCSPLSPFLFLPTLPSFPSPPGAYPLNPAEERWGCGLGSAGFELKIMFWWHEINNQPLITCVISGILHWHCTQIRNSSIEITGDLRIWLNLGCPTIMGQTPLGQIFGDTKTPQPLPIISPPLRTPVLRLQSFTPVPPSMVGARNARIYDWGFWCRLGCQLPMLMQFKLVLCVLYRNFPVSSLLKIFSVFRLRP